MDDIVRREYLMSNISYRCLAIKHNVSISTLTKRAGREDWVGQRALFRTEIESKLNQNNIDKKVAVVLFTYQEILKQVDSNLNIVLDLISEGIKKPNISIKELQSYTSSLKKVVKMRDSAACQFHDVLIDET